ncbi:MAG: PHB depolymerase family esterase [Propionicimonas sp.]|uniref:extracellular catalytic domain type 1 short-chain-length polyhydroxyalkanoate depolymerase n=1 Tax=Propionicimonas sp. TaxID=1955623 RepID=UPI003D139D7E
MSLRVLILLLALIVSGCGPARASTSPAPEQAVLPAGRTLFTLSSGGLDRTFSVHRPAAAVPGSGYPLVVVLHGGFGSGAQAETAYGWDAEADAAGFLVAYPDGVGRAWNAGGGCCGRPGREGVDDVAWLSAMVARVEQLVAVDRRRVYVTGMSNGAIMAYRLACETDIFAAVAPVAGTMLVDCAGAARTSVLHIHGAADDRVRLDGGRGSGVAHLSGPPVRAVVDEWRERDGCGAFTTSVDGAVARSSATCPDGRQVELVVIAGAGHQWPGSSSGGFPGADPPSDALSATTEIWDFFLHHPAA